MYVYLHMHKSERYICLSLYIYIKKYDALKKINNPKYTEDISDLKISVGKLPANIQMSPSISIQMLVGMSGKFTNFIDTAVSVQKRRHIQETLS